MQSSETIQKISFDGPLSIWQLAVLGIVVTLITGYFTWRDCKASASLKIFALLFLSRLIATIVALWMLAGASLTTLVRHARPKSVVLLVDSSGSMDTVDPVDGSGNAVNWSAASVPAIETLDQIQGALRSAQSGVAQIRRSLRSEDASLPLQDIWKQSLDSAESAASDLDDVIPSVTRMDAESAAELKRVSALLKSGLSPLRRQRMSMPRSPTHATRQSLTDRLEEADGLVGAAARRIEAATRKIAAHYEETATPGELAKLSKQSGLSRKDKVVSWLEEGESSWIKDIEAKERVLRYSFAGQALPVAGRDWRNSLPNSADANVTDLNAALGRAAKDAANQTLDAVLLVTDGGHNAPGDPRQAAAALRDVPLFVVPIGDSKMPRDVILHHAHAPRAVFLNDNIIVDAMVTAYGCQGESLRMEMLSDGVVVDRKTNIASSAVYDARVSFQQKATAFGRHKLQVRVLPLPNEHSLDNNEAQMEVDVMEDTIRVLVADDRPRWEFRYLVALFKRDKHVEFDQLLFEPDSGAHPSFPKDAAGWRRYRVIILGDVSPAQLPPSQQESLRKYVTEEGGNLILIAGETAMPSAFANQPLGEMTPVLPGGQPPGQGVGLALTGEGSGSVATQVDDDPLASERIWREISARLPVYLPASARPKPTSHVLISATAMGGAEPAQAFLSWQYVGLGRVIYLAAPVTFQLRYRNGDRFHHRFWGQLLRWAIAREMGGGSKTVRIATDKTSYERGDSAQVAVHLSKLDGSVVAGARIAVQARQAGQMIATLDLREEPASPGVYDAELDELPLGLVSLRVTGAAVDSLLASEGLRDPVEQTLTVDPKGSSEMSNPMCNLPLLKQIADATGGSVMGPAAIPNALSMKNAIPEMETAVVSRQPVWNRWICLWVFMACITFEWLARRYWRMI